MTRARSEYRRPHTMKFIDEIKAAEKRRRWLSTDIYRGYYLCVAERKYYFGKEYTEAVENFEKACNKLLGRKMGINIQ